jgi:RNA polymerase sigma factor (sigma-70 family)
MQGRQMDKLAPPQPQARVRLTDDQVQDMVLRTVATQAESLLRTAYRHSLCADDAHDAYQRGMELLLRRAHRLDPGSVHKWIHVVVKHEAMEVRRARSAVVADEDIDFDRHPSQDVSTPEERAVTVERATRAAEALRRLKPQELRAMWLKAMGHSYAEISDITGFSATKVNRCITEGRKSFLERFEGIEAGSECERWQPVLSAIVDGEATAAQLTEARPHLRNCPACRATLRGLHDAHSPLAAVLPVGLIGAGAKLSGLLERVLPGVATADPTVAAGGAGALGLGGAKLAGVLAAGVAATAGGGLVVAEKSPHRAAAERPAHHAATTHRTSARAAVASAPKLTPAPGPAAASIRKPSSSGSAQTALRRQRRLVARRRAQDGRVEFAPRGVEAAVAAPATAATSSPPPAAPAAESHAPAKPAPTTTAHPIPVAPSTATEADSSSGEFAPQP